MTFLVSLQLPLLFGVLNPSGVVYDQFPTTLCLLFTIIVRILSDCL